MKKLIFIPLLLFAFTACDKGLLNTSPRDSISSDNFFRTETDLDLFANSLLSVPGPYDIYLSDQGTDNAATTGAVEVKTIMTGTPTSQNITGGWSWGRLREINFFLKNIPLAEVSEEVKAHYLGLSRLYRAQFYFEKVMRYSDVPWYDQVLDTSNEAELYKPQDSREMVMANVMEDLAFAANNIREDVPTGTPNKWVAVMYQARIALTEGTYRKYHSELNLQNTANDLLETAAAAAKQLMDTDNFSLFTTGDHQSDYHELFITQDLIGNPEMIFFEINDFALGKTANHQFEMQDYEQSPSRDLVQSYLMADGTRFTDQANYATALFVDELIDRDPRLAQTLAYPGWIKTEAGETRPYVQALNKNFSGYHLIKGFVNDTEAAIVQGIDVPVLRYAEALLTYAEARAELGSLTQGDLDVSVNLLRARVNMPDVEMAVSNANPDPFLQDKYPAVTGANTGIILEIRRERRVEMAFEGTRFSDLMRWSAGYLLENTPQGMYFPGLGQYDLTGDGVVDITLISLSEDVPQGDARENNSLGIPLVYYRVGTIGSEATVYLENGENGGATITESLSRTFTDPRDYYRPIPFNETVLNPNLTQPFGWE
jgi:hypothetical protein